MARIHERVSDLPVHLGNDVDRAIVAASRKVQTRDAAQATWREIIVPLEIDGAVHRVKINAIDLGEAT